MKFQLVLPRFRLEETHHRRNLIERQSVDQVVRVPHRFARVR